MAQLTAVCRSDARGTVKQNIKSGKLIADWGLEKDAHAGHWHRQISLLSQDQVDAFNAKGAHVDKGAFGENLCVSGLELRTLPVGCRLKIGTDAVLEITQIGKQCHSECEIFRRMGECIMPREGVFARVVTGGWVKVKDEVCVQWRTAVITVSDRSAAGMREDKSGPAVCKCAAEHGFFVQETYIVPDDRTQLSALLHTLCAENRVDLILTTGGTGFAPRDVTPEATMDVIQRPTPGIAEAMRAGSMKITSRAMLSRAVAGICNQTLIVNLPGSPKGAVENLECVIDTLGHGIALLKTTEGDCAR